MPVGFFGLLLLYGFVLLSAFSIWASSTSSVFRIFDVSTALLFSNFWRSYSLKIQNSNGFNTFHHRICVTFPSGSISISSDHLDRSELIATLGEWGKR
ncbi:hypothetical protein B0H14DRAFT_2922749, partial [Mycena olivaceomarginata]